MKQNEVRKTTCPNFTEILGKTLRLPKKNDLRHLKDCATKKKVWHLKMSTGSLTKRPFCTQHFETTRFCISKNFVPCSLDKARTRERSSAREVSGNPFCARFLSQTENQGSTNFFLSSKKQQKRSHKQPINQALHQDP